MAVDKNKIIAEATKLASKGAFDKAIAAYQKITAEDPKEVRILLKIGELHQKKGDDRSAAQAFERVAETYSEQGFFLKAVAVYKQIAKLDPDDVRVNERLAGLYQQLGLVSDAMSQYQFMAAAYEKAGDGARLTDVLRRMVELDPDNIASSIKLGELYARANQAGPALECFRRAADYLKRHNRADEYVKVAERISALSPGDLGLTRELANIHLAKGDTKRALAKLQLCFKADPKDVETLSLLAHAFRDLGQISKTVSVYKELARVHEEHGRAAEAGAVWRKVQELAPDDEEAAAAVGAPARSAPAPRPAAAPPPGPPPGVGRAPPPGRPPGAAPPPAAAPQAAPAGPDALAKLLTETGVYEKYGLHEKALEHLRKILALDPQCGPAHEKARDALVLLGRNEEAGRAGAAAVRARVAKGEMDAARDAISRLRQIAPGHPELRELNAIVGGTEEVSLESEMEEEVLLAAGEVSEQLEVEDDALALAAARMEDEEVVEEEAPPVARGPARAPSRTAPDDDALALAAARMEDEEVVEEEAPPPPRPPTRAAAPARPAPPTPPPARAAPPPPPARAAAPPPPPEPEEEEEVDLSDEIEEAEFFAQQGLWDEARDALKNLLAFYPSHALLLRKLEEVERKVGGRAPEEDAGPDDAGADQSFDIARELAGELEGAPSGGAGDEEFQYSVEDVFNQFKKGVEQTVRREDSATHYDLGIAYKEMGLLDDAIQEFEIALGGNDRKKEVDCLSMIGLCRMAKGEPPEAVKAFRRALRSDQLTKEAAKAIYFELACAYEAKGEGEAALYYFQRVAKADPSFRDAAGRAASLGGGPGRPPPEEAPARPRPAGVAAAPPRPGAAVAAKKNIGYL